MSVKKEEVLFKAYDTGWEEELDVTLISYEDGTMDLHSQTGPDFDARIKQAAEVLKARGLKLKTGEVECIGGTGAYLTVVPA